MIFYSIKFETQKSLLNVNSFLSQFQLVIWACTISLSQLICNVYMNMSFVMIAYLMKYYKIVSVCSLQDMKYQMKLNKLTFYECWIIQFYFKTTYHFTNILNTDIFLYSNQSFYLLKGFCFCFIILKIVSQVLD